MQKFFRFEKLIFWFFNLKYSLFNIFKIATFKVFLTTKETFFADLNLAQKMKEKMDF